MPSSTDNGSSWRDNCGLDARQRERGAPGTGTQTQRGREGARWYGRELAAHQSAITRRSGLSAPSPRRAAPTMQLAKSNRSWWCRGGRVIGRYLMDRHGVTAK